MRFNFTLPALQNYTTKCHKTQVDDRQNSCGHNGKRNIEIN